MSKSSRTSGVRYALVRDERGRDLFVPWYPLSRIAYVLRDPAECERLRHRIELQSTCALGVLIGLVVALLPIAPGRLSQIFSVLLLVYWAWWTRGYSRGLEKTRYEKPAA